MKIPGIHILKKAERKGNQVELPKTERLGLVQFFKLTFKEVKEDHALAYAGNLTYKALSAIFPFFTFLLSLAPAAVRLGVLPVRRRGSRQSPPSSQQTRSSRQAVHGG